MCCEIFLRFSHLFHDMIRPTGHHWGLRIQVRITVIFCRHNSSHSIVAGTSGEFGSVSLKISFITVFVLMNNSEWKIKALHFSSSSYFRNAGELNAEIIIDFRRGLKGR